MKVARKLSILLVAVIAVAFAAYRYLRYEQRVEIARYQFGLRQGIAVGKLQERQKVLDGGVTCSSDGDSGIVCQIALDDLDDIEALYADAERQQ